ncbi:hypothetical protein B0H15DRAFT_957143 [Mycena belliarum]|uniref:Uncharacterized protein n=1 Tax=Mycena belliarum TaxID=1033014 RepID=A0AAD6TQG7_9AGAR|nr:hypothetical protein B0H15DRAFT_957143 [Mycena belliae]
MASLEFEESQVFTLNKRSIQACGTAGLAYYSCDASLSATSRISLTKQELDASLHFVLALVTISFKERGAFDPSGACVRAGSSIWPSSAASSQSYGFACRHCKCRAPDPPRCARVYGERSAPPPMRASRESEHGAALRASGLCTRSAGLGAVRRGALHADRRERSPAFEMVAPSGIARARGAEDEGRAQRTAHRIRPVRPYKGTARGALVPCGGAAGTVGGAMRGISPVVRIVRRASDAGVQRALSDQTCAIDAHDPAAVRSRESQPWAPPSMHAAHDSEAGQGPR